MIADEVATESGIGALAANPLPLFRFDRSVGDRVGAAFRVADPDWWAELPRVTAPTLVVSGGDASFLPPRHLRDLAAALSAGEFITIDAGHSVHRDRPTGFAAAALAHLGAR